MGETGSGTGEPIDVGGHAESVSGQAVNSHRRFAAFLVRAEGTPIIFCTKVRMG